jgi:hypothetical protein
MVWVMQTGRFKKFLELVFGWPSLPLEVTFGSRCKPLAGVIGLLAIVVVAVASHHGTMMGSALLPLLAALSAFPGAFDGGLSGHCPAIAGGRFHIT